jgi:hypothetical protein
MYGTVPTRGLLYYFPLLLFPTILINNLATPFPPRLSLALSRTRQIACPDTRANTAF